MAHLVEISSAELTFFQVQMRIFHHKKPKCSLFPGLGAKALHFQLQGSLFVTSHQNMVLRYIYTAIAGK